MIQQAWLRVIHEEEKQSDKLVKGITQFFSFLESAKNTVTDFSLKSLMKAGQQLVEIIPLTPLGDKIKDYLTAAEAKPQVWFEQYLILKTLVDTEELAVLEERVVGWMAIPGTSPGPEVGKEVKDTQESKRRKKKQKRETTPENTGTPGPGRDAVSGSDAVTAPPDTGGIPGDSGTGHPVSKRLTGSRAMGVAKVLAALVCRLTNPVGKSLPQTHGRRSPSWG